MQRRKLPPFSVEETDYIFRNLKSLKKKFLIFLLLLFHHQLHYYSCSFHNQQCRPDACTIVYTICLDSYNSAATALRMTPGWPEVQWESTSVTAHLWLISVTGTLRFCLSTEGQMMFRVHVRTWVCVPHCCCMCHSRHGTLTDRQAGRKGSTSSGHPLGREHGELWVSVSPTGKSI